MSGEDDVNKQFNNASELTAEFEAVKKLYEGREHALRIAPNSNHIKGEFWDKNPHALIFIRTPAFKNWFGDWEAAGNAVMKRMVKTVSEAQQLLRDNRIDGKSLTNNYLGLSANISDNSISKMGTLKKDENAKLHALAVANIDQLFENAQIDVTHADKKNDTNINQIHRLGTLLKYADEFYPVKITVKEFVDKIKGTRIYSVEALEIESIKNSVGQLPFSQKKTDRSDPITEFNNRISQLYDSVKRVSKIVDENGVPLPVYRGTYGFVYSNEASRRQTNSADPAHPKDRKPDFLDFQSVKHFFTKNSQIPPKSPHRNNYFER